MSPRHRTRDLRRLAAWPLVFGLSLALGCHTLHLNMTPTVPADREATVAAPGKKPPFRVSQFVFYADFEVDRRLPLFTELANLREQVYRELHLPPANTVVHVYLFEDRERYDRFMKSKYPDLPQRRAFFVAQPHGVGSGEDLLVYTYWGDRIQEDLRHELTHALLHSVLKEVPLWLDEGLAEYFEVPPAWKGINYQHLDRLCTGGSLTLLPNLARLEQLKEVQQMTPVEYREAWAWVHFMLHSRPETRRVLVRYLQELRTNTNPPPLRPRLAAVVQALDYEMQRHVTALDGATHPVSASRR